MTVRTWKIDDPEHPLRAVIDKTHHLMSLDQIAKIPAPAPDAPDYDPLDRTHGAEYEAYAAAAANESPEP